MTTISRDKTRARLPDLSTKDLHWLVRQARKELHTRHVEAEALKERVIGACIGMANVMAGVTWALACRDSLRRSKGHVPTGGTRPASGEMWLPRELLTALRAEIKDRLWSPLGAESWVRVRDWLQVEAGRARAHNPMADVEALTGRMASAAGNFVVHDEIVATQFHVRMAKGEASVHIPVGIADRRGS